MVLRATSSFSTIARVLSCIKLNNMFCCSVRLSSAMGVGRNYAALRWDEISIGNGRWKSGWIVFGYHKLRQCGKYHDGEKIWQ